MNFLWRSIDPSPTASVQPGNPWRKPRPSQGTSAPPETTSLPAPARTLQILCAEDVRINQLIIRAQLDSMGHAVDMVESGLAAIHALAAGDYDLVLMDGRMPEMDGTDAARVIRAGGLPDCQVRNPAIYIIALTANSGETDRQLALAAGMNDYLSKPVNEAGLSAALNRAIEILASARDARPAGT